MPGHFHAVVWIDHKQARIIHFNVEDSDRTVIRPDHAVRDIHHGEKRTGHRIPEDQRVLRGGRQGDRRRRARSSSSARRGEKDDFAKFLGREASARSGPMSRGSRARTIRPTANCSITPAAIVKAADRMRP